MSLIGNIDGEFGGMAAGVSRAGELTAEAANAAGQIVARSAGSGFTVIAQRMGQVREAITQLQGQLAGIGRSISDARASVNRASEQMSPEEMIKILGPVAEQIIMIHNAIGAAVARLDQIRQQAVGALQGGQPEPMLRRMDAIKQVFTEVTQRGHAAKQHVETVLAQARQVGAAGN